MKAAHLTRNNRRQSPEAAEAVRHAESYANTALWGISQGEADARDHFDAARQVFRSHLDRFIESSRAAMTNPN